MSRKIHAQHDPKGEPEKVKYKPTDGMKGPFLRPATPDEIERAQQAQDNN